MEIIVASNNEGKIKEIKSICSNFNFEILSLKDKGIFIEVIEDGNTIQENSYKKAIEIYNYLKDLDEKDFCVLSDDSGLMIDALNGAPGVISARFSGENSTSDKNNDKVLSLMNDICEDDRGAKFITVLTFIDEYGRPKQFEGVLDGKITFDKRGENGFGYDPIFYLDEFKKTLAEIPKETKNNISHRFKALIKLREYLENN